MPKFFLFAFIGGILFAAAAGAQNVAPINIAHRGASGYLPEHTLPAKALAHGMGADYIEQDLVLTKDNQPIVVHDIHLDTVTDVAARFPDRKREDGRYYAIDLTLAEIKTLKVTERLDLKTGAAVYPQRFPTGRSEFRISTLAEELELVQGLNKSTGREAGIYPEIKEPAWHRQQGADISPIVLKILADYGYKSRDSKCFLQCFEAEELKRIKNELKSELPLIQLLEENADLDSVASYATGIGPWIGQIITGKNPDGTLVFSNLVEEAHARKLLVHPYTFRIDALVHEIPQNELLTVLFEKVKIDGIFSDFPDVTAQYLKNRNTE
ncbi:MAG: glycerophosphodiester phosphodiesterase [Candidatus Rifleibacteriota bacterium]